MNYFLVAYATRIVYIDGMIKLKLDEMLNKRNLTAYALHKQSGLHQSVIGKIKNNQSKALQLAVLDTLCAALQCSPSDLIEYVPETVEPPELPDVPETDGDEYLSIFPEPEIKDITVPVMTEPKKIVDFLVENNMVKKYSDFTNLFRLGIIKIDGVSVKRRAKIHLQKGDKIMLRISINDYRIIAE